MTEEKGKTVGDKKAVSSKANKKTLALLLKPASLTPSNMVSSRSIVTPPIFSNTLALDDTYFKNRTILKLTDLCESQVLKCLFKCQNLYANILSKHSDIHNYNTRNNNFIAPKYTMKK